MLQHNDKKINTAFRRLRERRQAVGIVSTAETPEQEAKRAEQEMRAASEAGDIAALLKLVRDVSKLPVQDFIDKTCGSLLYTYYTYIKYFHTIPVDIMDLIDGLLYMDAHGYAIKDMYGKKDK